MQDGRNPYQIILSFYYFNLEIACFGEPLLVYKLVALTLLQLIYWLQQSAFESTEKYHLRLQNVTCNKQLLILFCWYYRRKNSQT